MRYSRGVELCSANNALHRLWDWIRGLGTLDPCGTDSNLSFLQKIIFSMFTIGILNLLGRLPCFLRCYSSNIHWQKPDAKRENPRRYKDAAVSAKWLTKGKITASGRRSGQLQVRRPAKQRTGQSWGARLCYYAVKQRKFRTVYREYFSSGSSKQNDSVTHTPFFIGR